ncbi:hypothetical protein [Streptomyces sp. RKAG337]|uniref:hypothetical protein n=1 Tax=Streptomyces sp. RKAG337 TaxID=2893404 RepID=UPI002033666E|nr:hypothetical protein [Streptomyces sp. RKAG337]MCM2431059.1 hypothetical protein [Streptomyces sp. RKAG337]
MVEALVIQPDGIVRDLTLADDPGKWRTGVSEAVGGFPEAARYHRGALLYVNGDGAEQPNLAAWALASAWRGLDLPYALRGSVVVTGPGEGIALPPELADQVRAAAESVARIRAEWQFRPPVLAPAGMQELLAEVRFHVPAGV